MKVCFNVKSYFSHFFEIKPSSPLKTIDTVRPKSELYTPDRHSQGYVSGILGLKSADFYLYLSFICLVHTVLLVASSYASGSGHP